MKDHQKQQMLATYSILEKNKEEIINKWMEELSRNTFFQNNDNASPLLKEESKQLISSLLDITKNTPIHDIEPKELEPIIKMLIKLSKSKARLGYTAKDTAMYLFSLKKTFVDFLNKNYSKKPNFNISAEITNFNNLLDIMGIFAFEEYSQDHQKEVKRRDEVISYLRYQINNNKSFVDIIGQSPQMQEIFKLVGTIIDTEITVLIQGESGTGKELIAEVIHYNGPRKKHPFIAINCGALPGELIESELFGHEKGAFTGAINEKLGKFELASEGTLFLDEIGELPLNAQVKLLRALQNMQIQRVGGTKTIQVNTRIIAATNRDLDTLTQEGKFRKDLLYRLNIFPINMPSLKDRKDDILPLTFYFLNKYSNKYKKNISAISNTAQETILQYTWPGNVRELENTIHRSVIIAGDSIIQLQDINIQKNSNLLKEGPTASCHLSPKNHPVDIERIRTLSEIEKEAIEIALHASNYNIKKTSEKLGISRTTLYTKIKEYRIKLSQ
ncbi:MAG: sigma-54-dependent Fis family transcriptional regulator [Candidatus Margulisiibacteriota bacterium]|nr:MAG: hypothetical protein A2X43_11280 [Candidatus Margulisbacteria bacterium GWD2_39_127]OGI04162.1 MAG: hypothetical protein A2X42_04565 [Candidatus Margulisbacteria bacterium GWF2_38_17]OGI09305.1 MAG: hypothetical protein A2X41_09270 [Candidatus Margulisbacteria bacterium GWE2_39_32]PZM77376.1 MAG: sigma-54-dependent Fis family transcriptional regulator [Candidatus Margulisiibacteriota bacterium]HAR63954.1 sigma-54-dependent Fis family transcriptional regulator [Candidatus Margulisiibacte